ncbi:MAG: threonine synthase [Bacteroidales bacterium]|jgi:threonine synthase|nr:threonine synthase [Bacteroidales bacterium]
MNTTLICPSCGEQYPEDEVAWRCRCGSYLDLAFTPHFDPASLEGPESFLRFRSVLPLSFPEKALTFGERFTPLHPMLLYGVPVRAKMDFLLTTGSFKDRGAFMMINKCRELGITRIVEDSSGNSACAMAAYSALAGIEAHIFMPQGNSSAKTIQVHTYGAMLHKVPGNRADCARAAEEAAKDYYYAAHTWNPYFLHGTKTVIYEIMEQSLWQAPDVIFVPVGSGSQLLGIFLGLQEMKRAGIISRYPRLMAVQSEHCAPLKSHMQGQQTPQLPKEPILAEGIAIRQPPRLRQIIEALSETGGETVTVTDQQIVDALKASARQGIYIEPTSAAAVAAVGQFKGRLHKKDKVVVILTGHGLKATPRIEKIMDNS